MRPGPLHKIEVVCMKAEQLAIHSLSTAHRNLEEALDAYSAAGFRYVEPYLPLVKAWIEDGHTVDETRELFDARDLQLIASSELAVECFHASDVLLPNLRANAENARLISELGGENASGAGNYTILEAKGRGHYVGCVLNVRHLRETTQWNGYGEGTT
jgi:sugar phosphate isomerase/epimerase